ncbi:hypothetical protein [Xanthomarina gelatinilytica]
MSKAETCHSCEGRNPLNLNLFPTTYSSVIPAKSKIHEFNIRQ